MSPGVLQGEPGRSRRLLRGELLDWRTCSVSQKDLPAFSDTIVLLGINRFPSAPTDVSRWLTPSKSFVPVFSVEGAKQLTAPLDGIARL